MNRNLTYFIGLLLLWSLVACDATVAKKAPLENFIPSDSELVLKINDFNTLKADLSNNEVLQKFVSDIEFLQKENPFYNQLHPKGSSIISFTKRNDSVTDITFVSHLDSSLFQLDSIKDRSVETLVIDSDTLQRIVLQNKTMTATRKDSVFIVSSSQKIVQDLLNSKSNASPSFQKAYQVMQSAEVMLLNPKPKWRQNDSLSFTLASQLALDLKLSPSSIQANGIVLKSTDSTELLSIFEGQLPQSNEIAQVAPTSARSVFSFGYSDASRLLQQLAKFRGDSTATTPSPILESLKEIAEISVPEGNAIAMHSIDPSLTEEAFAPFLSEIESFRNTTLYSFDQPQFFKETFQPLLTIEASILFQLEDFFLLAENQAVAESLITAYTNEACVNSMPYYEQASKQLSSATTLAWMRFQDQAPSLFTQLLSESFAEKMQASSFSSYPFAMLQFSNDRDFAHVNLVCSEVKSSQQIASSGVSERFNVALDKTVLNGPYFFSNHRTNGLDVVVQDIGNTLYLVSEEGKTLWTKQLEGPILGKIQEVDILRNGKKQLAFATSHKVYILDRTGRPVAPFPMSFRDEITQPLSVFDYDNNRNYRFVVTQGRELFMYNQKGQSVKGFTFDKASSEVVLPPQHIRMGNKDYIIVAEKNGKLNILHRTGKTRVTVKEKFEFSDIPIAEEGTSFVIITKDNTKVSISQSGRVERQPLNVSNSYHFAVQGAIKATLDDNLLRINGKLIELPFGIYTAPKLYRIGRETYVTVTETQEKRTHVFTRLGESVSNFPVYGTSEAEIASPSNSSRKYLTVRGDENHVLLYSF
ncbi:hypothetical protein [Luteirhabdus pelagi]|uniref:hypothetical protein n=1 Tax=Luteirhabdus pelagi TaxID=2792783 RepID=UPI00193A0767|nr:hypothetical protein [Luteirhabdus pelagi]